jgi:hypothetical protein
MVMAFGQFFEHDLTHIVPIVTGKIIIVLSFSDTYSDYSVLLYIYDFKILIRYK